MEDIIELNKICETKSDDYIADAELIGIPINDFIDKLKDDILKISPSFEMYLKRDSSPER